MVDEQHEHCDIILQPRSGHWQCISETHRAYDSLQYSGMTKMNILFRYAKKTKTKQETVFVFPVAKAAW